MTDDGILARVKKESGYKQTSGDRLQKQLMALKEVLQVPLMLADQNAPTSVRQASNYVPMDEWRQCLLRLQAEADSHDTLSNSMALVFMTYVRKRRPHSRPSCTLALMCPRFPVTPL